MRLAFTSYASKRFMNMTVRATDVGSVSRIFNWSGLETKGYIELLLNKPRQKYTPANEFHSRQRNLLATGK